MGCAWGEVRSQGRVEQWCPNVRETKKALINLRQVIWSNYFHMRSFRSPHMALGLWIHELCILYLRNMQVNNTASLAVL